jgi:hypothetical protein
MNTVCPVNNNRKIREGFSGLSDILGSGGDSSSSDPSATGTSSTTTTTDPNASATSGSSGGNSGSGSSSGGGGGLLGMFGSGGGSGSGSGNTDTSSGNATTTDGSASSSSTGSDNKNGKTQDSNSGFLSGIPGVSNVIGGSTTDSTDPSDSTDNSANSNSGDGNSDNSKNKKSNKKNNNGLLGALGIPGIPGIPGTETDATMSDQEMSTMNNIFIFMIHILISIVIAYVWGILGANALFLITESDEKKEYIFPTKPYELPYCDEKKSSNSGDKSWLSYGFPYSLGTGRVCNSSEQILHVIEKEEKNINIFTAFKDGSSGDGVSDALFNYLFNAIYGGLGRGGRSFAKMALNMFNPSDSNIKSQDDTWQYMQNSPIIKTLIFFIFPILLIYVLIYAIAIFSGLCGVIFGILNNHPFWGLFFTLILGIPIFFGNAIYMGVQSAYLFGLYPCMQTKGDKYKTIFNDVKSKITYIFYGLIIYYAFLDLGQYAGAGMSLIILFSLFF